MPKLKTKRDVLMEYHGRRFSMTGCIAGLKANARSMCATEATLSRIKDLEWELKLLNREYYEKEKSCFIPPKEGE